MKKIYCCLLLTFWTFLPGAAEPAARFELVSVTAISQAVSRMGDCIAPDFRNTVAGTVLLLTMSTAHNGLDLTRPLEISFYSFGKRPSMRIAAYALPVVKNPPETIRMQDVRFKLRRQGSLAVLETEDLNEAFPAEPPGRNLKPGDLLRGFIRTDMFRRQFRFGDFKANDSSARLLLNGLDDLISQLRQAEMLFSADESSLKVELSVSPRPGSALHRWMKLPLPPKGKIEIYPGAQSLTVLRLNPTGALLQYGKSYLEQGTKVSLPVSLTKAANGFAAMSSHSSAGRVQNIRLTAGISPEQMPVMRNEVLKWEETPFSGWYRIRRAPLLLCCLKPGRIVFFGTGQMDSAAFRMMSEPAEYKGSIPDRPFVYFDLKMPERPLAELRFDNGTMRLTLQAPDSWFADRGPLLKTPLMPSFSR